MSILVTGGAGFIGSHLIEHLLEATDEDIVCVDNFNTDYDPNIKQQNVIDFPDRVIILNRDISDYDQMVWVYYTHEVSRVIHLAAKAGVSSSIKCPAQYVQANIVGTLSLLEAAVRRKVRRFIFVSSSTVYGDQKGLQQTFVEDFMPGEPLSPYGATKQSAELLSLIYWRMHGVPVIILRPFSVHGSRMRPDLAIPKFVKALEAGKPVTLYGNAWRDYTHVDDVCDGIVQAVLYSEGHVRGECINLGMGNPVRVRKVATLVGKYMKKHVAFEKKPAKREDMIETRADLNKAKRLLNYSPRRTLEQGIKEYLHWYEQSKV